MEVTLTLRFRVVDPEDLAEAIDVLFERQTFIERDAPLEQRVEAVVANLDVIALARGGPQGWLDVGLERIA